MVRIHVGGRPIDFMVDAGAEHLVVTQPVGPLSQRQATFGGGHGQSDTLSLPAASVMQCRLYLHDCPVALMGQDLSGKLQTQITFISHGQAALTLRKPEAKIMTLMIPRGMNGTSTVSWRSHNRDLNCPSKSRGVWAEDKPPGLARNISPGTVELKPGAGPICQKQYFIPRKAQLGIQKHLERLLKYGIL